METRDQFPFHADGKALASTRERASGDLLIEGFAADFRGLDRQGENFAEGAFQRAIRAFLTRQATLAYHHRHELGIGKVLELREVPGRGLWMRARVDYQPESSPLHWIYNGVKKGTYSALSVGGFFRRRLTANGWRITDMDFTEVSVTPVPVHPGTSFAVVAGKALSSDRDPVAELRTLHDEVADLNVALRLDRLDREVAQLRRERGR
jgi:HK97 family phage prohead protease